ncbi:AraC family transcriptional regulator [Nocardiopsis lambiniae]|uniref:AraC family transcriptional regulator ligand-binding domain-containing protein n=1 Tax=Nocardiopsis lambiniae TaxID=3075539 RepID=A0ABU2M4N4_9ACTN|nr:AraC family transcriptional regulator ligand-binding domain-containing protein [Nocardiopsis sp. DSM 44743]MDT0327549.1 AraC family transcriptional regulator ligand-binding domain-containing protein [Nocardiopsis sp. DSM 44743]
MQRATIAAGLVAGLFTYAERHGADPDALATASGVSREQLRDPDARVPLPRYLELVRAARVALDDDALALHYGAEVAMADVSIVGLVMEAAPDMAAALRQLQRYGRLAVEVEAGDGGPRFELERLGDRLLLVEHGPVGPGTELSEEAVARLVCGPRRFLDRPHVLRVRLTRGTPECAAEYERVLGCPVRFGARRTEIELHPEVGSWPVARHPRYVFGVLREKGDALLARRPPPESFRERVEEVVRTVVHEGDLGADAVAARLHCSRSTLSRRLRAEGTGFRQVVDDVRRDLAIAYLRAGRTSVGEVAYLVGFSDAASFSRTFRRWTGQPPGRFREGVAGAASAARRPPA